MALEIKQQLKLTQQLVMTPQLQQAIKLLQLSRLELVTLVQQELQENPVLEEVAEQDEVSDAQPATQTSPATETESPDAPELTLAASEREPSDAEKVADVDWQSYAEAFPQTGFGEVRDDDERRSLEATLTRRESLAEHLIWQLQLSEFDEAERLAAECIVGNLDDEGFLRAEIDEMAEQLRLPEEIVLRALVKVQTFDPPGVAARDLRECLLMQVDRLHVRDPLVRRLLADHLPALQKRDFRGIARVLGITIEEVAAAAREIARLEPRPGREFGGDDPVYITPDIFVYKLGDEFHVVLNEDGLPKLRISQLYREVLARGPNGDKSTRDYVNEKIRSATWLIKSIHQRQRTIYKVMQSIIKHQRDFFERGVRHLKPLNLRDVADDIEMHESTVSRVTTNKYVHTPQGIYELKYFFNSSIARTDGDAMASEAVKEHIRRIVAAEDPRRPLSDQRIAEMLRAANIDIARRTVTKYREAMNILSSTQRREVG